MMRIMAVGLAIFSNLLLAGTAMAYDGRAAGRRSSMPVIGGRLEVLGRTNFGDTIISGRTGFHRSDFGVMVPDSGEENFVRSGSPSVVSGYANNGGSNGDGLSRGIYP